LLPLLRVVVVRVMRARLDDVRMCVRVLFDCAADWTFPQKFSQIHECDDAQHHSSRLVFKSPPLKR